VNSPYSHKFVNNNNFHLPLHQFMGRQTVSTGDQHEECTHGPGHLGRKLAKQIPGRKGAEPNRGSLARVSDVVETGGKIGIANESTSSSPNEIG
jgi:hypothetical protein